MRFSCLLMLIAFALILGDSLLVCAQTKAKIVPKDSHGDALPDGALLRVGTARMRHLNRIRHVQFSPDGKYIASLDDQVFALWDRKTGAEFRRVPLTENSGRGALPLSAEWLQMRMSMRSMHPSYTPAALSGDGAHLAVVTAGKVHIQDPTTGKEFANLPFKDGRLATVALSRDGKLLARGAVEGRQSELTVVDAATGKALHNLRVPTGQQITLLCFSADGKFLAGADWGSNINLWDLTSGKRVRHYESTEYLSALSFLPRSNKLASSTSEALYLWDLATDEETARYLLADRDASAMAFSADGATVATSGKNNTILLWDTAKGLVKTQLTGLPAHVCALAYSADGKQLVAGTIDGTVHLWDIEHRREVTPIEHRPKLKPIAFLHSKVLLAKAGHDGTLHHLDISSGKVLKEYDSQAGDPTAEVVVAPNGKLTAQADAESGAVHLWDIESDKESWKLEGHATRVTSFIYSPDSLYLGTLAQEKTLRIWNTKTGKQVQSLELPIAPDNGLMQIRFRVNGFNQIQEYSTPTQIAFSPDNRFLIFLASTNTASLWEMVTGKERGRFSLGNSAISVLTLSADGRLMASAGKDDVVRVWDTLRTKMLQGFVHPDGEIGSLAFDPSGQWLAAGCANGAVILYDVEQGKERRRFLGHRGSVTKVLFTPSGDQLLSAGEEGDLVIWDIHAPAPAAVLPADLDEARLAALWDKLGSADSAEAYKAVGDLSGQARAAVSYFQRHLKPTERIPAAQVKKLIDNLSLPQFAKREKAEQALIRFDSQLAPALEEALAKKPSVEGARRIQILLARIEEQKASPHNLRSVRAVEVLERIASPDSLALLEILAGGAPHARLTSAAESALERRKKIR